MGEKRIPNEAFHLDRITDNPMFEGFSGAYDAESVFGRENRDEDMCPKFDEDDTQLHWEQPRFGKKWKPLKVIGRVAPFNDYPQVDSHPAFSQRACDVLREFLDPNGELLPLKSDVGVPYYFYNVTTISDVLDVELSEIRWRGESVEAGSIEFFAFHRKKLAGLSIFRLLQWPMEVLVTDEFAGRVRSSGLNGFRMRKVWPFDKGVNWRQEAKKTDQTRSYGGADIKKETLVVILPLQGKKPATAEKKAVKKLEDELDAQLRVYSMDEPYFGSYEGSDIRDSGFRLFLSCPAAEKLLTKLHPWLIHLNWPKSPRVMKRFGLMLDESAREELVKL